MKQIGSSLGLLVAMLALAGCKPAPSASQAAVTPPAAGTASASVQVPATLQVFGVEPFWGVKVEGSGLAYTTPETMDQPRLLQGKREQRGDALTVQGGEGADAFKLTITPGPCSDGMSDISHPFNADFVLGTERLTGCAHDPAVAVPAQ